MCHIGSGMNYILILNLSLIDLDKVYPLPENWPKLPQIFRRRSCEFTTSTEPCVNKAISHLELLQNVIDEWNKEKDDEEPSRQTTTGRK